VGRRGRGGGKHGWARGRGSALLLLLAAGCCLWQAAAHNGTVHCPDGFTGGAELGDAECGICGKNYFQSTGSECGRECDMFITCSGHGRCDGQGQADACICFSGFSGNSCSTQVNNTGKCGDGVVQAPETCDDGCFAGPYSKDYPGCDNALSGTPSTNCDRNTCSKCPPCLSVGGDGCSSQCTIEEGYDCAVAPDIGYVCQSECGDGIRAGIEMCDDGNNEAGDGCFGCEIELGWDCQASLSSGVLL